MKQRIVTGIIGGAAFISILYYGGILFASLISLLAIVAFSELLKMTKMKMWSVPGLISVTGMILPILASFVFQLKPSFFHSYENMLITVMLILLIMIVLSKNQFTFEQAGVCIAGIVYIGMGFYSIISIREFSGLSYFIFVLILIWTTDSAAYFTGKSFGKTKLWPSISPNKTIEGSLGGVVFAILVGVLFKMVQPGFLDWTQVITLSALVSIVGQLGDLVESAIKRHFDVKDSGSILPGHGGILDRFDSQIFVFLALYLLQKI